MTVETYSFRLNLFARERTYRLEPSGLHWSQGRKAGCIRYDDVKEVRLYRKFMRGKAAIYKAEMSDTHLHCRSGRLVLSPLHYAGFRTWEDRSNCYRPFADAMLAQLRELNPHAKFVPAYHWTMRLRRHLKRQASAMAIRKRNLGMTAVPRGALPAPGQGICCPDCRVDQAPGVTNTRHARVKDRG
jgi:hypothetical protein